MADIRKEEIRNLFEKYKERVEKELGAEVEEAPSRIMSREYGEFRKEFLSPRLNTYERLCNTCEKFFKIKPDKKKEEALKESISVCHLNITPSGVTSFSILAPLLLIIFGSLITFMIFKSFFFIFSFLLVGMLLIAPLARLPNFIAASIRLKESSQMVLCIFYVVTYMRHTSNLELAIKFAAEHLAPPISLDLRKVLWDVETEKYESVKESLDVYLATWKKWNMEFIESFHLIEGSLYEGSEDRRLSLLDKSLDVILDETYEKMLHYAHNLKSPITMLHMLGIILPILGLVILPLVVSFMDEVKWFHLAFIYDISLPIAVYYMGKNILSKRPTGYGDTDISEENPELKKYRNILLRIGKSEIKIDPMWAGIIIFSVFLFLGLIPVMLHLINPDFELSFFNGQFQLLGYRLDKAGEKIIGPYGLGASILSMGITLSLGLGIGTYFRLKSKNVIKIREKSKMLEQEFASALFRLKLLLAR